MKLIAKSVTIALLVLNISLILASLGVKSWGKVDSDKILGLYSCEDCGSLKSDWNYECLGRSYCEKQDSDGECSLYSDLYKASYSYIVLEFCALVLSLLFLEKLILILFNKNPGPKFSITLTAVFMLVIHLLGIILWFSYSEAGNECEKTNFESRPNICFTQGPALAVANCVLMLFTIIIFLFTYKPGTNNLVQEFFPGSILWFPRKIVVWTSLFFLTLSIILMLASITVKKWVQSEDFEGSLLRCEDCDTTEWLSWTCLKSRDCEINSSSSTCSYYKELSSASRKFLGLQGATFIFLIFFAQNVTVFTKNRVHGFILTNYGFAIISLVLNIASIITWFHNSGAVIKDKCSDDSICASSGPQLAIASSFLMLPSVILFILSFYRRKEIQVSLDHSLKHYNSIQISKLPNFSPDDTEFVKADPNN